MSIENYNNWIFQKNPIIAKAKIAEQNSDNCTNKQNGVKIMLKVLKNYNFELFIMITMAPFQLWFYDTKYNLSMVHSMKYAYYYPNRCTGDVVEQDLI